MSRVDEAFARAGAVVPGAGVVTLPQDDGFVPEPPESWADAPVEQPAAVQAAPKAETLRTVVPPADAETDEKLVSRSLDDGAVEQYRRLAARLHLEQAQRGMKVVMVSSALPGEGKTLTAANLALTLSHSYRRRVLLIDGDLRRPWIHQLFSVENIAGLNDGLRSEPERQVPLIHYTEYLTLLTAGRPDPDPMSVLSSDRMQQIVSDARAVFDWVVVDTPPVGLLSDGSLLAAMVDAVLLVVEAGRTPFGAIQRAVQALGRESIFGVILNRVPPTLRQDYRSYYHEYSHRQLSDQ